LEFTIPPKGVTADRAEFWQTHDRILASLAFAKSKKHAPLVTAQPWDLVIVDEAHHCKNRATQNWQLVNALQRRFLFLLSATPVQNNLVELYNLLTLLAPGHLRTEADFKKQYVRRGNPRDARNRERLRTLLGEVMVRNTRSLVQLHLPPRYAQTILARPDEAEAHLYRQLTQYLRRRGSGLVSGSASNGETETDELEESDPLPAAVAADTPAPVSRLQLSSLLAAQGSHPVAVAAALQRIAAVDPEAQDLAQLAASVGSSAKDARLLELIEQSRGHKLLIFVNFRRTLNRLQALLHRQGLEFSVFSGDQSAHEKDEAVAAFRERVPIMLCTESGGEGRNLQFADTLIN